MGDLINSKSNTISSILLVDVINEYRILEGNDSVLRHSTFLEKIERELDGDEQNFLSTYLDGSNRQSKCYDLPKDEATLMLMSESRTVRKGVLVKLRGFEQNRIPQTYAQALMEAGLLALEVENKNKIIEQLQPKADFFDQVTGSKDCFDMADVAKVCNLGVGRNTLFQFLRDNKILRQNNTPFQQYVDCGYFRVIESKFNKPDGSVSINLKTVVYQKGIDFIIKRYVGRKLNNI